MANLTFSKSSIPLWTGSSGSINVEIGAANPAQPIDRNTGVLLNASFGISGGNKASFGSASSVQLGFDANTSVKLAPIGTTRTLEMRVSTRNSTSARVWTTTLSP